MYSILHLLDLITFSDSDWLWPTNEYMPIQLVIVLITGVIALVRRMQTVNIIRDYRMLLQCCLLSSSAAYLTAQLLLYSWHVLVWLDSLIVCLMNPDANLSTDVWFSGTVLIKTK